MNIRICPEKESFVQEYLYVGKSIPLEPIQDEKSSNFDDESKRGIVIIEIFKCP